ncbi:MULTISPECIES: CvpA family protein [unclassified Janthinobacterium]|uniref:CvpA family protein n=1 Tax=unclassified Janthinobacterium TaxID=2610881 RepID=UPI0018CBD894|nr:CvpA family protein [Janthinobacterium sp. CG_23.4]MDH6158995.1 membrane protein required for colicin V production [Janthinobacterium sp. CG_23.4]
MTIFDYLVLFVLVTSVLISMMRGLVKEMLSLVSWVVAFVVANAYGASLAKLLPEAVPGEVIRLLLAFVLLFIGVRILMGLLSMTVDALVKVTGLSLADRTLGSLFGVARGLMIVLTAVILCGMTSIPQQPFWKNASLSPFAEQGARAIKPYLPAAYAQHVKF